jgi:FAD/FMN-containing dehydrogenase
MSPAIDDLLEVLGNDVVTVDEISSRYHTDWTGTSPCEPAALVRPRTTEQVATALSICNHHRQPVVAQGGMTGLTGAAVPRPGDVALSLERLVGIEELDPDAATMTVWAGTTLEAAQQAALGAGFELTYDLGARGSCTVGGNVATNAGGNRVIRYGMAREHVLGLEVVLADGTVLTSLNKLLKNNAGFDLKQLFIGSEGTLGVVTRVVLRIRPAPAARTTALLACPDYGAVLDVLSEVRRDASNLTAFEVMWPDYYWMLAGRRGGITPPIDTGDGLGVLIELSGNDPAADEHLVELLVGSAIERGSATDAFVARSQADTDAIWGMREAGPMDGIEGLCHFDLGLPTGSIDGFVVEARRRLRQEWPEVVSFAFGHIGDSNLHFNATIDPGRPPSDPAVAHRMEEIVYATVAEWGGSISAEHGIGTIKKPYLHHSRTEAELDVMRRIRTALDPHAILNRGKVI